MVAREACRGMEGKEKERGGHADEGGRSACLLSAQAWQAWTESWRGRCAQLTASWASAQEARSPCPLMPSILLRFKRGNVLFIGHRPVETWQPLDGSDPTGILVTSACLLLPLNRGCSNSKRLDGGDWTKGKRKSSFSVFCRFHETWAFSNGQRLQTL